MSLSQAFWAIGRQACVVWMLCLYAHWALPGQQASQPSLCMVWAQTDITGENSKQRSAVASGFLTMPHLQRAARAEFWGTLWFFPLREEAGHLLCSTWQTVDASPWGYGLERTPVQWETKGDSKPQLAARTMATVTHGSRANLMQQTPWLRHFALGCHIISILYSACWMIKLFFLRSSSCFLTLYSYFILSNIFLNSSETNLNTSSFNLIIFSYTYLLY